MLCKVKGQKEQMPEIEKERERYREREKEKGCVSKIQFVLCKEKRREIRKR